MKVSNILIDYCIYNFFIYAFKTNKKSIMDTLQSQSSKVLQKVEEQMDELIHIISNDDGTIN